MRFYVAVSSVVFLALIFKQWFEAVKMSANFALNSLGTLT